MIKAKRNTNILPYYPRKSLLEKVLLIMYGENIMPVIFAREKVLPSLYT